MQYSCLQVSSSTHAVTRLSLHLMIDTPNARPFLVAATMTLLARHRSVLASTATIAPGYAPTSNSKAASIYPFLTHFSHVRVPLLIQRG